MKDGRSKNIKTKKDYANVDNIGLEFHNNDKESRNNGELYIHKMEDHILFDKDAIMLTKKLIYIKNDVNKYDNICIHFIEEENGRRD